MRQLAIPAIAARNLASVLNLIYVLCCPIKVVKGCVSVVLVHATLNHVYLDSRVYSTPSSSGPLGKRL